LQQRSLPRAFKTQQATIPRMKSTKTTIMRINHQVSWHVHVLDPNTPVSSHWQSVIALHWSWSFTTTFPPPKPQNSPTPSDSLALSFMLSASLFCRNDDLPCISWAVIAKITIKVKIDVRCKLAIIFMLKKNFL